MGLIIIFLSVSALGWVITTKLRSKFAQYAQLPNSSGMTGKEVGEEMMRHYGVSDVNIVEGKGLLTDHYNPQTKTVTLSPDVYHTKSIAAAAVAAHEVGHVVQHATAYNFLTMRSMLVPIVQISSRIQTFLFLGLVMGLGSGVGGNLMMTIVVLTFGITALFSLITLPVEFDASNRALAWLDETGTLKNQEYDNAKDALWWAAMTYVAKALTALIMFGYFLLVFMKGKK